MFLHTQMETWRKVVVPRIDAHTLDFLKKSVVEIRRYCEDYGVIDKTGPYLELYERRLYENNPYQDFGLLHYAMKCVRCYVCEHCKYRFSYTTLLRKIDYTLRITAGTISERYIYRKREKTNPCLTLTLCFFLVILLLFFL